MKMEVFASAFTLSPLIFIGGEERLTGRLISSSAAGAGFDAIFDLSWNNVFATYNYMTNGTSGKTLQTIGIDFGFGFVGNFKGILTFPSLSHPSSFLKG